MLAVGAPTVNSYKRIGVGAPTSGATWSPAYATYGMNNRTQAIRIPAPGRIEIRAIDGSANPYLAAAALLGAGLDGVANDDRTRASRTRRTSTSCPRPTSPRAASSSCPPRCSTPSGILKQDAVVQDWLGQGIGESYVDYFVQDEDGGVQRVPRRRLRLGAARST